MNPTGTAKPVSMNGRIVMMSNGFVIGVQPKPFISMES
jgi:hypothetical protein